jgi:MFS family permease
VFACALAVGTMIGAVEVGLPALAGQLGSHGLAGVLLALWSLGSMAGGVLYSTHSWRQAVSVRHVRLLAFGAVLTVPLLLVDSLAWAIVSSVLAGLATAPVFSCQYTLISTLAPAGAIAEAFTWQTAALVGGIAAGSALGGALIEAGGAHLAFVLAGAAATAACLLAVLEGRRARPLEVFAG